MIITLEDIRTERRKLYRATSIGQIADIVFKIECLRLGIEHEMALIAPLDSIAEALKTRH